MKKIVTLMSTLALLLVMVISLAGCGADTSTSSEPASNSSNPESTPSPVASLVDVTTDQGISLKLPSGMTVVENFSPPTYVSSDKTEICNLSVLAADEGPISSMTEESILTGYQGKYQNVVMKSFKNDAQLNGKDAAIFQVTMTSPAGADVTMTQVAVTDNKNYYIVNFMYPTASTDGALAKNLQACIDSITTAASSTAADLVEVTSKEGITLKIPSEWVLHDSGVYINTKTGDNVAIGVEPVGQNPLSSYTKENVQVTFASEYQDVVVKSFENGKQINGKEALVSQVTLNADGDAITLTLVIVTDGTNNYIITYGYPSAETGGSLIENLQASIDSITIK